MRSQSSSHSVCAVLRLLVALGSLGAGLSALAGLPATGVLSVQSDERRNTPSPTTLIGGNEGTFYGTVTNAGIHLKGVVFQITRFGTLTILHNFYGLDGKSPMEVIQGRDGNLYGITSEGGTHNAGTVFRIRPKSKAFKILHSFDLIDGANPQAGMLQGKNSNFYGTTLNGGAHNAGTMFMISLSGKVFKTLHSFARMDGSIPASTVIQGRDGSLYGTTYNGSTQDAGTIFRVNPNGTAFKTLHSFTGSDGSTPSSGVIQGRDGNLYGTTYNGSTQDVGTIFRVNPNGAAFKTLHSFTLFDGIRPSGGVMQAKDGNLYGTTEEGGPIDSGTVFKISPRGANFKVLHTFEQITGFACACRMIQGTDGTFYGTTRGIDPGGIGTVFKISPNGANFKILHKFNFDDGFAPSSGVIQGKDGTLYGTTRGSETIGMSTVFRVSSNGTNFKTLHTFDRTDGFAPSNRRMRHQ